MYQGRSIYFEKGNTSLVGQENTGKVELWTSVSLVNMLSAWIHERRLLVPYKARLNLSLCIRQCQEEAFNSDLLCRHYP
jgi:hypothetical protein